MDTSTSTIIAEPEHVHSGAVGDDTILSLRSELDAVRLVMDDQVRRIRVLESRLENAHLGLEPVVSGKPSTITCGPPAWTQSGVQNLPVELLVRVFTLAADVNSGWDELLENSSTVTSESLCYQLSLRQAIAISHVCRHWRLIVLDVSELWCNVYSDIKPSGMKTILNRSKTLPLRISHSEYGLYRRRIQVMYIINNAARWKHLHWISSEDDARSLISLLNSSNGFSVPALETLHLSVPHRKATFTLPAFAEDTPLPEFPLLAHLRLACVSPEELPPSRFPSLRTLYMFYPVPGHSSLMDPGASVLRPRMSTLMALLFRTPNLEQLTLDETAPLLDIELLPPNSSATFSSPVRRGARRTPPRVYPLRMSNLTSFSWYHCPSRDLWRIFHFVSMPHLQSLHLFTDSSGFRWPAERDGVIFGMTSATPLSPHFMDTSLVFSVLENLTLEFSDSDALLTALRKFSMPSLKNLSLSFVPPKPATPLPSLPSPESIFRHPPMPHVESLSLSYLTLDPEHTRSLLRYMPRLQSLSLEGCSGVSELVRSLCGRNVKFSMGIMKPLDCPELENLTFVRCDDLRFDDLAQMILSRKHAAEGRLEADEKENIQDGPEPGPMHRAGIRPCKPLRKRRALGLIQPEADRSVSTLAPCILNSRPRKIKSVHAEGCGGLSEFDLCCLRRDAFGVVEALWEP